MTTAFDAKVNLFNLIKNDSTWANNGVYYGHPGETVPDFYEWTWIGEIEWDDTTLESMSSGYKENEIYEMIVTFESHWPDDDQLAANNRVKTKLNKLQQLMKASPNPLTISNPVSQTVKSRFLGEGKNADSGRGAIMVASVRVIARI